MARIVFAAAYNGPYAGTFIPATISVAAHARELGYEFIAVFPERVQGRPWVDELRQAEVEVILTSDSTASASRRLASLQSGHETVFHTHFSAFDTASLAASRMGRRAHVLWHVHTPLSDTFRTVATNKIKYRALNAAGGRLVGVAPHLVEACIERGARPDRAQTVPNGIRVLAHEVGLRDQSRARLRLDNDALVAVTFAHDPHRKGLDRAVRAIDEMVRGGRKIQLVVVGAPDEVRRGIDTGGLAGSVTFRDPASTSRDFLASADVFLSLSRAEGMPFSVLEALAMRVPVVATPIPGQTDIADAIPSLRLTNGDASNAASEIAAALTLSQDERSRQALETRRVFGLENWAEAVTALYTDLLVHA